MNRRTLDQWFDDAVRNLDLHAQAAGTDTPQPELEVRKLTAYVPVSCCTMTDTTGDDYCSSEHAPWVIPAPSWHVRLRTWLGYRRYVAGAAIGSWLSGWPVRAEWDTDDE